MRVGRPAVFLDLNGTIILPLKVSLLSEYYPIPMAAEAVASLTRAGFVCPVVTVQSRIGKGVYTESEFRSWFRTLQGTLADRGAVVEGPYVCPHRFKEPCPCKKPSDLLYRTAAADLRIDLARSFVVGDTMEDLDAARVLGCPGILVRTGWEVTPAVAEAADHVADDLQAAVRWITSRA